jgi:hypothetical protein
MFGFVSDKEDADGTGGFFGQERATNGNEQGQREGKEGRSHETGVFRYLTKIAVPARGDLM